MGVWVQSKRKKYLPAFAKALTTVPNKAIIQQNVNLRKQLYKKFGYPIVFGNDWCYNDDKGSFVSQKLFLSVQRLQKQL